MNYLIERKLVSGFNNHKNLRDSAKMVLALCLNALEKQQSINFEDIYNLWLKTNPCLVYCYSVWHKDEKGNEIATHKEYPYTKGENEGHAKQWFIRNLGRLIVDGYLNILPNIKFIKENLNDTPK